MKLSIKELEERIDYMKSRRIVLQDHISDYSEEADALEIDLEDHEVLLASARSDVG